MLSFDGATVATANLQTGRVKIIATAAEARNPMLPDVPTLREVGYEMGRSGYNGLWGPPGMSPAVAEVIGTWYRVHVGSFATSEQATALCNSLKDMGGQCVVQKN